MHRQNTKERTRGMSTPRQGSTSHKGKMSTPRQTHVGMTGTLDGRGNPVIGRPPPPTNWERTIDNLSTETKGSHWLILTFFALFFLYVV